MYSGLIYGHILLIAGSTLVAFNLTSWYREIMAEIRGQSTKKKTRWIAAHGRWRLLYRALDH